MLCSATLRMRNRSHDGANLGDNLRLRFADTYPVFPSPTVWRSAFRGPVTLYPLEHNSVAFPSITFLEIADILPSVLLEPGFFNPPRMANEHTHRHPLQDVCMEYDTEPLFILGIGQEDRHKDFPQHIRLFPPSKSHFLVVCCHLWPMLFWDGVIEILTDEVAIPIGDADCETAIGSRLMVFKVGDQRGAVA